MTHFWGYRIPLLVVPVELAYAVLFEAGQQVFRGLGRARDTTDLVDNYVGLAVGLLVGALVVGPRWAVSRNAGRVAP